MGGRLGGSKWTLRVKMTQLPTFSSGACKNEVFTAYRSIPKSFSLTAPKISKHLHLLPLRLSSSCFNSARLICFGKENPHPSDLSGICILRRKNSNSSKPGCLPQVIMHPGLPLSVPVPRLPSQGTRRPWVTSWNE